MVLLCQSCSFGMDLLANSESVWKPNTYQRLLVQRILDNRVPFFFLLLLNTADCQATAPRSHDDGMSEESTAKKVQHRSSQAQKYDWREQRGNKKKTWNITPVCSRNGWKVQHNSCKKMLRQNRPECYIMDHAHFPLSRCSPFFSFRQRFFWGWINTWVC